MAVFNQKKNPIPETPVATTGAVSSQSSLIGKTLIVKGEIFSEDEILIDSKFQGKITVKNRVVIGRGGDVEAEIDAREVVIQGKVTGNVKGSQRVEIVPAGTLHGNIQAPRVVIADTGVFEGNIEMRPRADKGNPPDGKPDTVHPGSAAPSDPHKPFPK
jgi:cytoskeletal protein CcmA (bactofilin family)